LFSFSGPAKENPASFYLSKINSDSQKEKLEGYSGLIAYYTGFKPDSAIYFGEQALSIARTNEEKALVLSYMGLTHNYSGEFKTALDFQLRAMKTLGDSKDKTILSTILHHTGIAYDYLGEYDKSLENHFKSLAIRKQENDLKGCQNSLSNIGLIYYFKGDFRNSIKFLFAALEVAEYLRYDLGIASVKTNLALVYQSQEDYEKELRYQLEAQKIYEKIGNAQDIAMGYNNIGSALMDNQQWGPAIPYHKKSLELKKEIGDNIGITMSMQNLASCYLRSDSLEQAEMFALEGYGFAEIQDDAANKIELTNTLASIYLRKKEFVKAEKYLLIGLQVAENFAYVREEKLYKTASEVYEATGRFDKAYDYLGKHFNIIDSVNSREDHDLMVRKEMESEFRETEHKKELEQLQKDEEVKLKRETEKQRQRYLNIILLTGIAGLLIFIFFVLKNYREKKKANAILTERNSLISRQHAEISTQKQLIEEKNKDITDSLQYAKRLQDAILPETAKFNSVFSDYFILYKPKDIVSGDFYWMEKISGENKSETVLFAVVDCTGHGVPGGFVSIVAHNALNRAIKEFKLTDPALILDKISELVEESFRQNENKEIRDGMDISLCKFQISNLEISNFSWAGANNPLWIVRDKKITEYKADKQPVGLFEDRKPFTSHSVELQKGDSLYLFSDGYADQFGGPAGKKFKYAQLKEIIIRSAGISMPDQKSAFDSAFEKWRNWPKENGEKTELEQIDDVCIIGVRI